MQLVDLICTRVTDITLQDAVNRRMETAELMQALCGFREVASRYRLPVAQLPRALLKEESPELRPLAPVFPLVCGKTQCLFCIGDESRSYEERMGSFCRPSKMMDHTERSHLKGKDPQIECCHSTCKSHGGVLKHLQAFKGHVQTDSTRHQASGTKVCALVKIDYVLFPM
jgi:hypothetical protein